ncbi:hypothetical protein Aglo01_25300 [Actinokineospora globicatena]|nr:hypothetical protein Aglo01_25300 [Actinokineospora globicatena]GLW85286.1 hypothetical protein Aglo02_29260 [Actinokineospora globicatena]
MSCHPVNATGPTPSGRPHRFVNTTPAAIDPAPPNPAAIPIMSTGIAPRSTINPTPTTPATPHPNRHRVTRSPSSAKANPTTNNGCTAPNVAATPPGNRYAATNNNALNAPMFNTPNTATRPHHTPTGPLRLINSNTTPAGNTRITAAPNGTPAGNNSVVTKYVVPQLTGATAANPVYPHVRATPHPQHLNIELSRP